MNNKTNKKDLDHLIETALFANSINELRLPLDHDMDAFKNNATSMKDQPGPMIDGEGNYKNTWDQDSNLPISSSELVNNQSLIRVDVTADNIASKDIDPTNVTELSALIQTAFKDLGQNDLTKKEISAIWKVVSKVIKK